MDETALKFSKDQLLKSTRYAKQQDILSVILESDKEYSHEDIAELLKNFYESKVK